MSRRQQSGFTIVEMMIATAIFSIILLIITSWGHGIFQAVHAWPDSQ